MSLEFACYLKKSEEVILEEFITLTTVTQLVSAPLYSDLACTQPMGTLGIRKEIFILVNGVVTDKTIAVYTYNADWEVPNKSSSVFIINLGDSVISGGTTEIPGTYFGALNGVASSGDFRNYRGSIRKIKDSTDIRQYLLSYSPFNPYNTLQPIPERRPLQGGNPLGPPKRS